MAIDDFANLVQSLSARPSRRAALRGLAALTAGSFRAVRRAHRRQETWRERGHRKSGSTSRRSAVRLARNAAYCVEVKWRCAALTGTAAGLMAVSRPAGVAPSLERNVALVPSITCVTTRARNSAVQCQWEPCLWACVRSPSSARARSLGLLGVVRQARSSVARAMGAVLQGTTAAMAAVATTPSARRTRWRANTAPRKSLVKQRASRESRSFAWLHRRLAPGRGRLWKAPQPRAASLPNRPSGTSGHRRHCARSDPPALRR